MVGNLAWIIGEFRPYHLNLCSVVWTARQDEMGLVERNNRMNVTCRFRFNWIFKFPV